MPLPAAFRETIRRTAVGERKYIRYFENRGHFAHLRVQLKFADKLSVHASESARLSIPEDCCAAALQTLAECTRHGPVRGFPLHNIEVLILGGSYLARHSYPEAFAHAARMAFDDAMQQAQPVVVEPWIEANILMRKMMLNDFVHAMQKLGEKLELTFNTVDPSTIRTSLPRRILPDLYARFSRYELLIVPIVSLLPDYRPVRANFRWDEPDGQNFGAWT